MPSSASPTGAEAGRLRLLGTDRAVLWALLGFNAVRLVAAFSFELVPQEAYYFFYSRHLALSYFDHPPAIAYLLRAFTAVLGTHAIAIRLTAFTLTALTQWSWVRLAGRMLPAQKRRRAVLVFASTGMVTVLSLISTPDVPLLLFWTLALSALHRALFDDRKAGWLWAGLWMGLAFDSKYTGVFLQVGVVLFLVSSARHRKLLGTPWPYLSLALAQAVMLPVYVWNAQHGFASFLFQTQERAASASLSARFFLGLLATQALLLGPGVFAGVLTLLVRGPRALLRPPRGHRRSRERALFLLSFCLPLLFLMVGVSTFALVKPNWLLPCYLSALLWAPLVRRPRWHLGFAALLHAVAAAQLAFYVVPLQSDDTWYGWSALAARVGALSAQQPDAFLFSADGYKTSAELTFYLGRDVYGANVLGERALEFDYVGTDLHALVGHDALFIDSAPRDFTSAASGEIPAALARHFRRVQQLEPLLIERRGQIVRKFFLYRGFDYRGP